MFDFIKRVFSLKILTLVAGLVTKLTVKFPWEMDNVLAIKSIILIAVPVPMSGALGYVIK